jgi:heme/copper-type cytochrome/quinol oxidase subunit 3
MTTTATAAKLDDAGDAFAGVSPGRIGMWVFLVTDAMGFAALLTAYAVLRVDADAWPDPHQRLAIGGTALMTLALVSSSFTMTLAVRAARAGREGARAAWLAVTVALGAGFLAGQALEYHHLHASALAMRLGADQFASTFYVLTGFHGAHVAAGVILLAALLATRVRAPGKLEVAALFWHFVDLAWIPIFSFLYLLPTV